MGDSWDSNKVEIKPLEATLCWSINSVGRVTDF